MNSVQKPLINMYNKPLTGTTYNSLYIREGTISYTIDSRYDNNYTTCINGRINIECTNINCLICRIQ